jgi:hypothetical protein
MEKEKSACLVCGRLFPRSSAHKKCPKCRFYTNKCVDCGKPIRKEYKYCRECYMKSHANEGREQSGNGNPNWKGGLSSFAKFVQSAKRRDKNTNLDATYLRDVYDKQNGICPFTGKK